MDDTCGRFGRSATQVWSPVYAVQQLEGASQEGRAVVQQALQELQQLQCSGSSVQEDVRQMQCS